MNKIFFLLLFLINFCYSQIASSVTKEEKTVNKSSKLSLSDTILFKPKFSIPIKSASQDKGWYPFKSARETIYRDNFTGRIYFQNGFDRTLIYSRNLK
ncbi:hypothetical protein CMU51_04210 [Elizabethkingia anophelis]|uniref:Uncharacterized protein n=1 Tax=Elizabethkingia anophelis TaxID=1117645 RepID=A0AAE4NZV1_9FLAO|nr:hypothetical protein [Elizabethkingia anophelis]